MKISYVSSNNISNSQTWTKNYQGLGAAGFNITKHLIDSHISVNYVSQFDKKFSILTRLKWDIYRYFFQKKYYRWADKLIVRNYAHQVKQKISNIDTNLILCTENVLPIAYLDCKQPIVLWLDSTLSSLINFYSYLDNLCDENIRSIYEIEATALHRCSLLIYTSEWAAKNAIQTYGVSPSKVKVIPWGANFYCNQDISDIEKTIDSRPRNKCNLLFLGVDWYRKGGDIAIKVVQELNKMGVPSELTIVGCEPPSEEQIPSFVKLVGYINQSTQAGFNTIKKLFNESHFLIMPSRAEAFGLVFCEASSFGVPSITTNVGGIPTAVKDGINGQTFDKDANIEEYCRYIANLFSDYSQYRSLALSSFNEYKSRLNWNVAVNEAKELMNDLI